MRSTDGDRKDVPLSEVATLIMGQSPPSSTYNEVGEGLPFFQGVRDFNYRYPTPRVYCSAPTRVAEPEDILFSVRAPIGRVNIAHTKCATGRGIAIIKPNDRSDARYLEFALRNMEHTWNVLETSGSVFGNATKRDLEQLLIPWPADHVERHEIAHILGTLDDKIELNRRMNETLEEMARAIFKDWFVDFGPVRAKMEGREAYLPEEIWRLFPDRLVDSELGEVPEGWVVVPLPEITDFREGPGIRHWQYTNSDEGTRFINIRCIQGGDLILDTANRVHDEEANGKYSHFHLREWDIVLSASGTLGRSAVVREAHLPLLLNTSVIRFRPVDGVTSFAYLRGYLGSETFLEEQQALASGSVQKNFGPTHLKQMKAWLPLYEIVGAYEAIAGALLRRIAENMARSDALRELRGSLLPNLIVGRALAPR